MRPRWPEHVRLCPNWIAPRYGLYARHIKGLAVTMDTVLREEVSLMGNLMND